MSEKMPPHETLPPDIEVRRDALLLRVIELREAVKETDLNQEIVSKELDELATNVQKVEGSQDMALLEEIFDSLEKIVDSKK